MDVQLYNVLLAGYGGAGNLGKVREILSILREDGIDRNAATYAAIFECLGRCDRATNAKLAATVELDIAEESSRNDCTAATTAGCIDVRRLLREFETDAKREVICSIFCMSNSRFF